MRIELIEEQVRLLIAHYIRYGTVRRLWLLFRSSCGHEDSVRLSEDVGKCNHQPFTVEGDGVQNAGSVRSQRKTGC